MAKKRQKIRYAVVGAGNIAQVAVLPAFSHAVENSQLVAVISGDADKRSTLQKTYDLEWVGDYADFERILEDGGIDAVYIATPNSLHKDFCLRAAALGVHVLCEKPLAPSVADCRDMDQAVKRHGVKLMCAYRLHFERATLAALDIVRSGQLGDVRLFSSFFTHVVRPGDIRMNSELAGGATYDIGVYCINAARNLFSAEPIRVMADKVELGGTDHTTTVLLRFPDDRLAQFCVSNCVASVSSYRVAGTLGNLRLEPAYEYVGELVHYLTIGEETKRTAFKPGDQFAPQLRYFSHCILEDRTPEPSAEEAICDMRVVEAILESARTQRPVDLPPYTHIRRPSSRQADHASPVEKPGTINAPSPSLR